MSIEDTITATPTAPMTWAQKAQWLKTLKPGDYVTIRKYGGGLSQERINRVTDDQIIIGRFRYRLTDGTSIGTRNIGGARIEPPGSDPQ